MRKEEGSRSGELRDLGWPAEDVRRYEELWEYRQRWGAINLEREDRVFLRRAEAALPKRLTGKAAQKKSLQEKAHVRWLAHFLEALRADPQLAALPEGEQTAWVILLEAELGALEQLQPVLGLPDTLKAKGLLAAREAWIEAIASQGRLLSFDFDAPLLALKQKESTNWKPLRPEGARSYPVLDAAGAAAFRAQVGPALSAWMGANFPSLKETPQNQPVAAAAG